MIHVHYEVDGIPTNSNCHACQLVVDGRVVWLVSDDARVLETQHKDFILRRIQKLRRKIAENTLELAAYTQEAREDVGQMKDPNIVVAAVMGAVNALCPPVR